MFSSLLLKLKTPGFSNDHKLTKGLLVLFILFSFTYSVCAQSVRPEKLWDKTFGGTSTDYFNSMIPTLDGGYLLGGNSNSEIGGDKSEPSRGDNDFWVVKIDGEGKKQWDKTFGGSGPENLQSMVPTTDGGYLLGGNSNSG